MLSTSSMDQYAVVKAEADSSQPELNGTETEPISQAENQSVEDRQKGPSVHELSNTWTFWYLNNQRDVNWEKRLKFVANFKTIEEFWGLFLAIRPPSYLPSTCDYNVFKEGIQPMWEVPENSRGGRWLISIDKSRTADLLDVIWMEVLLAVVGGRFGDFTKDICGVVVNIRAKGSKISIWTRDAHNDEAICGIGEILQQTLNNPNIDSKLERPLYDLLRYEDHQEVQHKQSSLVRAKYILEANDTR